MLSLEISVRGPKFNKDMELEFQEGDRLMIGRQDGDIEILDPRVSRAHCELRLENGKLLMEDLKSTGGTFFEGKKIELVEIREDAVFQIGDHELAIIARKLIREADTFSGASEASSEKTNTSEVIQENVSQGEKFADRLDPLENWFKSPKNFLIFYKLAITNPNSFFDTVRFNAKLSTSIFYLLIFTLAMYLPVFAQFGLSLSIFTFMMLVIGIVFCFGLAFLRHSFREKLGIKGSYSAYMNLFAYSAILGFPFAIITFLNFLNILILIWTIYGFIRVFQTQQRAN